VKFQPNPQLKRQIVECPFNLPNLEHSCIPDKECSPAVDMYQFGLLLSQLWIPESENELISKQKRCSLFQENRRNYYKNKFTNPLPEKEKQLLNLIYGLVNDDPNTRITVEEALDHPFFFVWTQIEYNNTWR